jgi:hypothetical protein
MPARSPIGRASTTKDLLFLLGPGGRNPCRTALFKTSLKLLRVLWTSSLRRRSTSGSSVTVVRTVLHHDSNIFAVKTAAGVRPRTRREGRGSRFRGRASASTPLALPATGDLLLADLGVPGLDLGLRVAEIFGHGISDTHLAGTNPGKKGHGKQCEMGTGSFQFALDDPS